MTKEMRENGDGGIQGVARIAQFIRVTAEADRD